MCFVHLGVDKGRVESLYKLFEDSTTFYKNALRFQKPSYLRVVRGLICSQAPKRGSSIRRPLVVGLWTLAGSSRIGNQNKCKQESEKDEQVLIHTEPFHCRKQPTMKSSSSSNDDDRPMIALTSGASSAAPSSYLSIDDDDVDGGFVPRPSLVPDDIDDEDDDANSTAPSLADDDATARSNRGARSAKSGKSGGHVPGEGGNRVVQLSAKTSKIMSAYEEYLSEIGREFPIASDEENGGGVRDGIDAGDDAWAAKNIAAERDRLRRRYESEGKDSEIHYGGNDDANLVRGWNYDNDGLHHAATTVNTGGYSFSPTETSGTRRLTTLATTPPNLSYMDDDDGIHVVGTNRNRRGGLNFKYTHPFLHENNKRWKRGMGMILVLVAIIAISLGVKSRNKEEQLSKLEGEMANAESNTENGTPHSNNANDYMTNAFEPKLYNRSTGWEGTTYIEALVYCGNIQDPANEYLICPYGAICPNGPDTEPITGFPTIAYDMPNIDDVRYVPLLDQPNSWVQIGRKNSCIKYYDMHGTNPTWGVNIRENEVETRELICCKAEHFLPQDVAGLVVMDYELLMSTKTVDMYNPILYNNTFGQWEGKSHEAARTFCGGIEHGDEGEYELCPYEAICPLGVDTTEPYGSSNINREQEYVWYPISSGGGNDNDFVQVSLVDPCHKYSEFPTERPDWPMGDTSSIVCCSTKKLDAVQQDEAGDINDASSSTSAAEVAEAVPDKTMVESQAYVTMAMTFLPKWYNRETGWTGTTYNEALSFCSTTSSAYGLCPYGGICPLGHDTEPLGGVRNTEPYGSWVPFADKVNIWVQTSDNPNFGGVCDGRVIMTNEFPVFGQSNDEEVTRHIACCLNQPTTSSETTDTTDVVTEEAVSSEATNDATDPAPTFETTDDADPEFTPHDLLTELAYQKYQPLWHDRSSGWIGQTYAEAAEYCIAMDKYELCPYDAICPNGLNQFSSSSGGQQTNMQWLAISPSSSSNPSEWVGLPTCMIYSATELEMMDEDIEDSTRNIACCLIQGTPTLSTNDAAATIIAAHDDDDDDEIDSNSTSAVVPIAGKYEWTEEDMSKMYEDSMEYFHPLWFDRTSNWHGQTYLEATKFCLDFSKRIPCPYEALCPMGINSRPLAGFKDEINGTWAPIGGSDVDNAWVQLGHENSCVEWSHANPGPPSWGETGVGNEEITRHIACCNAPPMSTLSTSFPSSTPTSTPSTALPTATPTIAPSTALPTATPTFAPTTLAPTGLLLTEQEQAAKEVYDAKWYGRDDGYLGTTHTDAITFCKQIPRMKLCPLMAYCPSGPTNMEDGRPLYLQQPAYDGEQWAPIASTSDDDAYVLVGRIDNDPTSTCHTFAHYYVGEQPFWGLDGSQTELKEHILCCKDPSYNDVSTTGGSTPVASTAVASIPVVTTPEWLSINDGWFGGSYSDANAFCQHNGKQLCPYNGEEVCWLFYNHKLLFCIQISIGLNPYSLDFSHFIINLAYCPAGPGQAVASGHTDESATGVPEGVQWAPFMSDLPEDENEWVMVGQKDGNDATTCYTHDELEGNFPDWGLTSDVPEVKKYIMCCVV